MKNIFLFFAVCLSTISLLSCGSNNEIETKVEELDSICPAVMWDGWIFQSVDYNGNDVTFTIRDEYKLNEEMLEADRSELKREAKFIIGEFFEAYAQSKVDDGEGDKELYTKIIPLIKAVVNDSSTGITIKWVDSKGNKVSVSLSSSDVKKAAML